MLNVGEVNRMSLYWNLFDIFLMINVIMGFGEENEIKYHFHHMILECIQSK